MVISKDTLHLIKQSTLKNNEKTFQTMKAEIVKDVYVEVEK